MNPIEGVDYSKVGSNGPPGSAALKAAGKHFVVRYLAKDDRGLTLPELQELQAGGIDIAVVYESTADRMKGGKAAGTSDAQYAQGILVGLGLPAAMPIYFACDFDPTEADQAVIDAYLTGAASVIGKPRVGLYGGYWPISRAAGKTAAWLWQTTAWSGGKIFGGLHLYQYAYNQSINGTDCDATQALQANYGQASQFQGGSVQYPEGMDAGIAKRFFGSFKASNGVTVSYSEDDELSKLWLASGSYGRIVDVGVYQDSPTITRLIYQFSDGQAYHRPNANEPITKIQGTN